jgi:hypothetical protein
MSRFGMFNMFGAVDPAGEFADYYLRFGSGSPTAARRPTWNNVGTLRTAPRRTPRAAVDPLGGLRPAVL